MFMWFMTVYCPCYIHVLLHLSPCQTSQTSIMRIQPCPKVTPKKNVGEGLPLKGAVPASTLQLDTFYDHKALLSQLLVV